MTGDRDGGDWPPELEALRGDPVMMLLAAVVWRARQDAPESQSARWFLLKVQIFCIQDGDPAFAILRAMRGETGAPARAARPAAPVPD